MKSWKLIWLFAFGMISISVEAQSKTAQDPWTAWLNKIALQQWGKYREWVTGLAQPADQNTQGNPPMGTESGTIAKLFSDTTWLYDDLYLYGGKDQFFTPSEYAYSLMAWYPQGAHFQFDSLVIAPYLWHGNDKISIPLQWRRILKGLDFLDHPQNDTLWVSANLTIQMQPNPDGFSVGNPIFTAIVPVQEKQAPPHYLPLQIKADPPCPDTLSASTIAEFSNHNRLDKAITQSISENENPPAKVIENPTQRQKQLEEARKNLSQKKKTNSIPKKQTWNPYQ